jgi:hypothetical protein
MVKRNEEEISDVQIFDGHNMSSRESGHQTNTVFADISVSAGIMRSYLTSTIGEEEQDSYDPFWWRILLSSKFLNSAVTNASHGTQRASSWM